VDTAVEEEAALVGRVFTPFCFYRAPDRMLKYSQPTLGRYKHTEVLPPLLHIRKHLHPKMQHLPHVLDLLSRVVKSIQRAEILGYGPGRDFGVDVCSVPVEEHGSSAKIHGYGFLGEDVLFGEEGFLDKRWLDGDREAEKVG
jgi:hypothetical protein